MPVRSSLVRRTSAASIVPAYSGGAAALERGRALLDAEPAQELALRQRPVHARAHAFGRLRQRLEVHMRGEIDQARRQQRIGEFVPADGLQGIADGALAMAVVDDQRGAAGAHHAPADLERDVVGAPFEDRADLAPRAVALGSSLSNSGIGSRSMLK